MHWLKSFRSRAILGTLFVVIAIVGISQILATPDPKSSSGTMAPQMPSHMAAQFFGPENSNDAFDTPFFNATEDPLTLSSLKGQGLVVNFWATWCPPCVKEMPALDRLSKSLSTKGVQVLAISEDRKPVKQVPPFYAKMGIDNLPLYFDIKGRLSRKFAAKGLPVTLLIKADGTYLGQVVGGLEWDEPEIEAYLVKALAPH